MSLFIDKPVIYCWNTEWFCHLSSVFISLALRWLTLYLHIIISDLGKDRCSTLFTDCYISVNVEPVFIILGLYSFVEFLSTLITGNSCTTLVCRCLQYKILIIVFRYTSDLGMYLIILSVSLFIFCWCLLRKQHIFSPLYISLSICHVHVYA